VYGANLYLATATARGHTIGSRIKTIFLFESDTVGARIRWWRYTLEMIRDAPVGGVGVGNFKIEYPRYQRIVGISLTRPHNDLLWILAETGVIGLLIYLLLIGLHFKSLIRSLFSSDIPGQRAIFLLGVFFATTAYLVNSLFTFSRERIYVSMLFSLCLALSTHAAQRTTSTQASRTQLAHLLTNRVVLTITYALLMVGFAITIRLTYADGYGNYARFYYRKALTTKDWNTIIHASTKAINHWTVLDVVGHPMHWYRGSSYLKLGKIKRARADLEKAYQYHPNHPWVLKDLAAIYEREGLAGEASSLYRNLDKLRKRIEVPEPYNPEEINTEGIEIPFLRPVEKGTISIKAKGGDGLDWSAEWKEKSVRLVPVKGKEMHHGTTYIITIKTQDKMGNPLDRQITLVTKPKE
jgi:hypothetical protein